MQTDTGTCYFSFFLEKQKHAIYAVPLLALLPCDNNFLKAQYLDSAYRVP